MLQLRSLFLGSKLCTGVAQFSCFALGASLRRTNSCTSASTVEDRATRYVLQIALALIVQAVLTVMTLPSARVLGGKGA
jgi:hypothetical protein